MIRLTDEPVKEPEVVETKPLTEKPNVEVTKKSSNTTVIWIVVLIVITIASIMLYNYFKNKDGNKPEPRA